MESGYFVFRLLSDTAVVCILEVNLPHFHGLVGIADQVC